MLSEIYHTACANGSVADRHASNEADLAHRSSRESAASGLNESSGPFGAIDDDRVDGRLGGHQPESELILNGREQIGLRRILCDRRR